MIKCIVTLFLLISNFSYASEVMKCRFSALNLQSGKMQDSTVTIEKKGEEYSALVDDQAETFPIAYQVSNKKPAIDLYEKAKVDLEATLNHFPEVDPSTNPVLSSFRESLVNLTKKLSHTNQINEAETFDFNTQENLRISVFKDSKGSVLNSLVSISINLGDNSMTSLWHECKE